MKKFLSLCLVALLLVCCLTGCAPAANDQPTDENPAATPAGEPDASAAPDASDNVDASAEKGELKFAVLVPGSINDGAWSSQGYNALLNFAEEKKAEGYTVTTSYTESKSPQDTLDALESYALEGYDMIYCHDYAMGEPVTRVADLYPETLFIISNGDFAGDNYSAFIAYTTEIGYQQGVMAAMLSESKMIGTIGSEQAPSITRYLTATAQGVTDTDPNAQVSEVFLGSNNDLGKAREATLALINSGVDVIITSASSATQGVMEGAKEAKEAGKTIYVFTNTSNQAADYPDIFVSTCTLDAVAQLRLAWNSWQETGGKLSGEPFKAGTKDGCAVQIWNDEMKAKLPAEVIAAQEAAQQGIWDGNITINVADY